MPEVPSSQTDTPAGVQGDGAPGDAAVPDEKGVMPFLDHLEELRWTLIKAGSGVLLAITLCAFFSEWIVDRVLIGPTRPDFFMYDVLALEPERLELLNRTITGQFFADIGTIIVVGLIAGSPVVVFYLWRFIEPALYPNEKQGMRFSAVSATFFFLLGAAFGYLILTPLALQFFAQYTLSEQIVNQFDIMTYFSMVTFWTMGTGLLFELPVVVYFLAKVGILTPEAMRTYRKYALIAVLGVAAFLTPPDPISQIIVAVPLLGLYELSIYVAKWVARGRAQALGMADE
ncbi:MAG: twin-arginine translocase subunit TatC [Salinibacter sp.]|jgi:Sec-independent protein translocase TatC|uniref:twin-arginine translocase subunit TatC n=1 Tax=Salinibacter sp. TaxID=2065818 RepID=UPI002FC3D131